MKDLGSFGITTVYTIIRHLYVRMTFYPKGPTLSGMTDDIVALQALILATQGSAGWLIAMSIGILIAEVIAIVLVIIDLQPNGKLIAGILVN